MNIFNRIQLNLEKKKNKQLQKALEQNEKSLREYKHLVNNNLQLILSVMNIYSRSTQNEEVFEFMNKMHTRVSSMVTSQNNFNQIENKDAKIDVNIYVVELIANIKNAYNTSSNNVRIKCIVQNNLFVSSQFAISFGLIIIEILSHLLDSSINNSHDEIIGIQVLKNSDGNLELIIKVNTITDRKKVTFNNATSHKLIELLLKQVNGNVSEEYNQKELQYKILFKIV